MKYKLIVILVLSGIITARAQSVPTDLEYYERYWAPMSPLYASANLWISSSIGQWGAAPGSNPGNTPFLGTDGMGAGVSFGLSFHQMVPLRIEADMKNQFYPGIKWGAEISEHGAVNWEASDLFVFGYDGGNTTTAAFIIGPAANYNYENKVVLEASLTLMLGGVINDGIEGDVRVIPAEPESGSDRSWSPGYEFTIAARTGHLRIFASIFTQRIRRYYEFSVRQTFDTFTEPSNFTSDYSISTFRFGAGITFGEI